jgi:hypothetical protein
MADMMAPQDPDMRTKMTAMRTDEHAKIKALLTDDQKTKYDAYLAVDAAGPWRRRRRWTSSAAPPQ